MNRLTQKTEAGYSVLNPNEAIARLVAYEDLHERVLIEQENIPAQLDVLRAAGKEKTITFRELAMRKLQNLYVLHLFEDL